MKRFYLDLCSWGSSLHPTILFLFLLLQCSNELFSQSAEKCVEGDCKNGVGTYLFSNGTYTGNWVNGKQEGKGIYRFDQGEVYEGDFKNNLRDGWGLFDYGNGSRYEGQWKEGKKHGKGTYFQRDGEVYDGDWLNNLRSGIGSCSYIDNSRYKGQWSNNLRHGKGIFEFFNGDYYNGEYSFGKIEGDGIYYFNSGTLKGQRYEGQFINNKFNGNGILYYPDGAKVSGQFFNGHVHGWAVEYKKSGEINQSGFWQDGALVYEGDVNSLPNKSISTVHVILFSDKNDRKIGITADETNKYFLERLTPSLQQSGLTVNLILRTGPQFNLAELNEVLNNLPTQENDAVLFYFVGHGYNKGGLDQFPTLTLGIESTTSVQLRQIDLSEVHKTLGKKPHRLLLTIAEACNAKRDDRLQQLEGKQLSAMPPEEFDRNLIKRLFIDNHGDFIVSSSSQGQLSLARRGDTGFFTTSFIQAFQEGVKMGNTSANWNVIFENAKKYTTNMAMQNNKIQIPLIHKN